MTPTPKGRGTSQQITTLATMTAALVLLVQVGMVVFPRVHPLVIAFVASLFLATQGLGWRFYRKPVDWVLGACLILSSANGITNMASNFASASAGVSISAEASAPIPSGGAPRTPGSTGGEDVALSAQQSVPLIKAW